MFRFTIRDLLWLMVVVGLAVGWLAENRIQAARHETETRKTFEWMAEQANCINALAEELKTLGVDPKEVMKKLWPSKTNPQP
jgi:hypothetical protein